jgi:ribosome-associated protein
MTTEQRLNLIKDALDDMKASDIQSLEVSKLTDMMDHIVICTATSRTHAKSIARNLEMDLKKNKITILGIEGDNKSDWVLVDIGDVVAHIMLQETRDLYELEKFWTITNRES